MAQNIVPDDVVEAPAETVEPPETGFDCTIFDKARGREIHRNRRKCKNARGSGIDLEIYGNTASEDI